MPPIQAVVKHVLSGDTLDLFLRSSTDKGALLNTIRVYLAGVNAPRVAFKTTTAEATDEPCGFEARELVRKRLIGQSIMYEEVGTHNYRTYVTIGHDGQDLAALLVAEGYAKVATSAPVQAPNIDKLQLLQKAAQDEHKGLWAAQLPPIRMIKWTAGDVNYTKAFAEKHKGEQLEAIVEHIRDGASLKLFFVNESVNAQASITGLIAPNAKGETNGEVLSRQSTQFAELRLLGRNIPFRVDGHDSYGSLYVTPFHPRGAIGMLLLEEGLARIHENSARYCPNQQDLRAATRKAQLARKGVWKSAPEAVSAPSPVESASSGEGSYPARLLELHSADNLTVVPLNRLSTQNNPPMTEVMMHETRLYLSSIRCPRPRTRVREAEPYAYEAFELVREMLAGKKFRVVIDYIRQPTPSATGAEPPPASDNLGRLHYVTIYVGSPPVPVNLELVRRGYAKTIRHRADEDRSKIYDQLLEAEEAAKNEKIGVHKVGGEIPKHRFNDLVGPENVNKARALEQSFRRYDKLKCVVDHVFNAARFAITIPSEHARMTFLLSGMRAPQAGRVNPVNGQVTEAGPYALEAIEWARYHLMHRSFNIKIQACDRGGAYIGIMYPLHTTAAKESINARVLVNGCARTEPAGLRMCPIAEDLVEAEAQAVRDRVGMWALPELVTAYELNTTANQPAGTITESVMSTAHSTPSALVGKTGWGADNKGVGAAVAPTEDISNIGWLESDPLVISHVVGVHSFFVQNENESELLKIKEMCDKHGDTNEENFQDRFTVQRPPKTGDIVLARFSQDDTWYRARVKSVAANSLSVQVLYLDYGNEEKLSLDRLLRMPPELNVVVRPPQAVNVQLLAVKTLGDFERQAADALDEMGHQVYRITQLVKRPGTIPGVVIVDTEDKKSLNEKMLSLGLAKINRSVNSVLPRETNGKFEEAEKDAKAKRLGMWFYGDVGDSDNDYDDDDMPVLRR